MTHAQDPRTWPEQATPAPQLETVAERLARLEAAVAAQGVASVDQLADRVLTRLREQPTVIPSALPGGLTAGYDSSTPGLVALGAATVSPYPGVPGLDGGFWARFAVFRELRLMVRMYFDPRYRLSRLTQLVAPIVLVLVVLNYFFVGGMPLIGFLVERVVLVVLALVLYKVLVFEAGRYERVLHYLAAYGR